MNKIIPKYLIYRGPVTWSDFTAIRHRMEQKWRPFEYSKELVLLMDDVNSINVRIKVSAKNCSITYIRAEDPKEYKTILIKHSDVSKTLELLDILNAKNWITSYDEKYEIVTKNYYLTFRFNTHIGDFFEITTKEGVVRAEVEEEILIMMSEFQLKPWTTESFDRLNERAWGKKTAIQVYKNDKLHEEIKDFIESLEAVGESETIMSRIRKNDNDFSDAEEKFISGTNTELLGEKSVPDTVIFEQTVSIVIPAYNCMASLPYTLDSIKNQNLTEIEKDLLEVVVVDDGSVDDTEEFVKSYNGIKNLEYIKQNNMGMACAGNTGVNAAKGEVILFVDADMILRTNYVREHAIRHSLIENALFISFTENISADDIEKKVGDVPNIYADFRFFKNSSDSNLGMYRHTRSLKLREVNIMEETNNFKEFGNGRIIEMWDLPSMVVTNALSFKKKDYLAVGGLSMQFKGWGMEDAFLGASFIAAGNYIVPILSTGAFHIDHPPRSGSQQSKVDEFRRNAAQYLELVTARIDTVLKISINKRS